MRIPIPVFLILLAPFTAIAEGITAVDLESDEVVSMRIGGGDPVAGEAKAQLCQGCHGATGNSTEPLIPKLAGQYGLYIAKELRNYQAGVRTHQIMNAMATTVNDEDLADISAYFASQKKMSGDTANDNPLGKSLFLKGDRSRGVIGCVNCHGVNGKGRLPGTAMFPVIGGQHKEYLLQQILNFRQNERTNSASGVMNKLTQFLSDEEISALAEYIAGL
jgi:cytochrome c553